jgi:hypothetical protein
MTVTATTFVDRFPEFTNIETAVVTATIAEAGRRCDSDVWGDDHDDAINYLTAHLLAMRTQAIGQQVGAISGGVVTPYDLSATTYGSTYMFLQECLPSSVGFAF